MTPQPTRLQGGIRLEGFRLHGDGDNAEALTLKPGDTLRLSLYWRGEAPIQTDYTVFTHLLGPDGQLYGQWDNPPVRGDYFFRLGIILS
ncbi:MAG: hypothetical protein ACE5G8_17405 [Anaerolineae bacterium]